MNDLGNKAYPFGYCTNVHAGITLLEAQQNLSDFASQVRQQVCPSTSLPIGLWLAEKAANDLISSSGVYRFRDWLEEHHFLPYTFNGFPQADFHQPVVKHSVYEPTWTCDARTRYTLCLAEILDALLPPEATGSISTVPLGWPHAPWHAENYKQAADNLIEVAKFLDKLYQQSGKRIVIAIEPEPGCVLNTAAEVVEFFEHYLFSGPDAGTARRYLGVCHDICHSGVMFESQAAVLELYRAAGIRIGKTQISSAVHVPWNLARGDADMQRSIASQLRTFAEPKFLHQTTRRKPEGGLEALVEDLPLALDRWLDPQAAPSEPWRVHFHVPIYVDNFGSLQTTQSDIGLAVEFLQEHTQDAVDGVPWFTGHYEVETYAWTVLPAELQADDLASGIAQEMRYFQNILG